MTFRQKQLIENYVRKQVRKSLREDSRSDQESFGTDLTELSRIFKRMQLNNFLKDPENQKIKQLYLQMYRAYKEIGKEWSFYP